VRHRPLAKIDRLGGRKLAGAIQICEGVDKIPPRGEGLAASVGSGPTPATGEGLAASPAAVLSSVAPDRLNTGPPL